MFEKEAYEWTEKNISIGISMYNPSIEMYCGKAFKEGAEFVYNKANEWHFIKNRDFPVREDYYVIACHSATGDFTDRCQWLNNEWWSADGEVKHFINEKVYAWKEKSQPPKESE